MPSITDEFFLYNLDVGIIGCVIVLADKEIPEHQYDIFSYEVCRIANVTPRPGIYRYRGHKHQDQLQSIIDFCKKPRWDFVPWDVEAKIREVLNDENSVVFHGVRLRVIYQYIPFLN